MRPSIKRYAAHKIVFNLQEVLINHYLEIDAEGKLVDVMPCCDQNGVEAASVIFFNGVITANYLSEVTVTDNLLNLPLQPIMLGQYQELILWEQLDISRLEILHNTVRKLIN